MPGTYNKIATTTLGSNQASVTFSSITSSYTDLIVLVNAASIAGTQLGLQFNSDNGTNYSGVSLLGNGSSALTYRSNNNRSAFIGDVISSSTTIGNNFVIANIMSYTNTNTFKTVLSRNIVAANGTEAVVSTWRSTAAINSLTFFYQDQNMKSGSIITIYGVLKA